jgi:Domain of unknown function (DUF4062)
MRIFVSSTFEDLREHRAAAIRVLRQLGHEVLAMEDLVALSAAPLTKVLEMVDRSEAYVGIFAWRYGYIPRPGTPATPPVQPPDVDGATYGETSITHYEYLRAVQRKLPVMAFLLDEQCAWPPQLIDGFDTTRRNAPANADAIRDLRQKLEQERVVGWFITPTDLEARVSAAVTMAGITRQLDLQEAAELRSTTGTAGDSSAEIEIKHAVMAADADQLHALKINLASEWWSTRLYLMAALSERLTQVRRIVIVTSAATASSGSGPVTGASAVPAVANKSADEQLVGQLSTAAILSTIAGKTPALGKFQQSLQQRQMTFNEVGAEIHDLLQCWYGAFGDSLGSHGNELAARVVLTPEVLRRWFADAMLQQPVRIADLQRASVVDLLRLLDYPNDYVPVLTRRSPTLHDSPASEIVNVMDKKALNARLARSYLVELMDRARIV